MKIKHQKLKSAGAFLTILLLLPYVVTVFVNGIDVLGMSQEPCVQAETEDQDGEKTVRTAPFPALWLVIRFFRSLVHPVYRESSLHFKIYV